MYPWSASVRQVLCYVETTARRGSRMAWMSVDHVCWLVHLLHDQFNLGEVLRQEAKTVRSLRSVRKSDWVPAGRQLKPEPVFSREAASLGAGAAARRPFRYAEKKELAYKSLRSWLEDD